MNKSIWLLIGTLIACGAGASNPGRVHEEAANSLVGAWETRLSLSHPYPLGPETTDARSICGTIAFVEDRSSVPEATGARATAMIGVYDLDLRRIGLSWLDEKPSPTAFAIARRNPTLAQQSQDSIQIVIKTGPDERITLLGRYDANGIDGDWAAQSARGAASGAFSMRRLDAAGSGCLAR